MFGIRSGNGYVEILDGIRIKTLNYGNGTLMTEFLLAEGSLLPGHSHPYEQTGYLVSGRIELFIEGSSRMIVPGDSWNIPPEATHRAAILEDSVAVEVFSPVRDDYLRYARSEDIAW